VVCMYSARTQVRQAPRELAWHAIDPRHLVGGLPSSVGFPVGSRTANRIHAAFREPPSERPLLRGNLKKYVRIGPETTSYGRT